MRQPDPEDFGGEIRPNGLISWDSEEEEQAYYAARDAFDAMQGTAERPKGEA